MPAINYREVVCIYLSEQLLIDFSLLGLDDNLFELGLIDSFGFIELVNFLETEFEIKFSDDDLMSGAMANVNGLVEFVRKKIDERQA